MLKGLDYLSKFINILINFLNEKYVTMGDIKEIYHEIFVSSEDWDALRFVLHKFTTGPIEFYRISVHKFEKIYNSLCIAN